MLPVDHLTHQAQVMMAAFSTLRPTEVKARRVTLRPMRIDLTLFSAAVKEPIISSFGSISYRLAPFAGLSVNGALKQTGKASN